MGWEGREVGTVCGGWEGEEREGKEGRGVY